MSQPEQTGSFNMNQIANITFGVEIETTVPVSASLVIGQYHRGTPAIAASHNGQRRFFPTFAGETWSLEADGSIHVSTRDHRACEFVSPILKGEEGIKHLLEFVAFLRELGAEVNASCGLHIHIGATSAAQSENTADYIERLVRLVAFNSKALYAQTGTTKRERGAFCAPLGVTTRRAVARMRRSKNVADGARGTQRYHILNLTNLPRTGTVEFRCFAGTLNPAKIQLHLFSVLALCVIARNAKTPAGWENKTITGTKALTNFLKVRPMTRIVGSPILEAAFPAMLKKALEMGAKYDLAEAGADLSQMANTRVA
jgi:hypothetical protein